MPIHNFPLWVQNVLFLPHLSRVRNRNTETGVLPERIYFMGGWWQFWWSIRPHGIVWAKEIGKARSLRNCTGTQNLQRRGQNRRTGNESLGFIVSNPQKAVKPSPLTPKHKQPQPKSNNSLIDNLPSLCLEGLLTRRGAHRGGSTRTRLLFTVFNRHFSDPYRFIACRENPLLS